jgi:xanthine dehydrogenase large subunit
MKVLCSTQHPSEMQHVVAHALQRPAHAVQVECRRMGGGFGGKESQSALFACVAAVARRGCAGRSSCAWTATTTSWSPAGATASTTSWRGRLRRRRPHPRRRATMVANAGHSADLSGPVMTRALCHFDNAYWLPHVALHGYCGEDEHAEQHRVPRLRRAAGRAGDRDAARLDRARAAARPACGAPRELLRSQVEQRHAVRPDGRDNVVARTRRRREARAATAKRRAAAAAFNATSPVLKKRGWR